MKTKPIKTKRKARPKRLLRISVLRPVRPLPTKRYFSEPLRETEGSCYSVHGLRHRVSDRLREAGAPTDVRPGFLGHANEAVSGSTYGGRDARLKEFQK